MRHEISKAAKVALCRKCKGTGQIALKRQLLELPHKAQGYQQCPQCEGSGRVTASCKMTLDIRPYHP